jgi:hypothetical protein
MGADKSAEKYPKIYLPKLSAHAQNFWDFNEKRLHWASVVHACVHDETNRNYSRETTNIFLPRGLNNFTFYYMLFSHNDNFFVSRA